MLQGCATCTFFTRLKTTNGWRRACGAPDQPLLGQWRSTNFGLKAGVRPCPGWVSGPSDIRCGAFLSDGTRCNHPLRDPGHKLENHGQPRMAQKCTNAHCGDVGVRMLPGEHCACGAICGTAWGDPISILPRIRPYADEGAHEVPNGPSGTFAEYDLRRATNLKQPWSVMLRYIGGGSDKFYEVSFNNDTGDIVKRWGRWGTLGQSMTASWDGAMNALREKLGKGYVPVVPGGVSGASVSSVPRAQPEVTLSAAQRSWPPKQPMKADPQPARQPSAADRLIQALTDSTQRPATVEQLAEMALTHGWQNDGDAPPDAMAAFRGAEAVRLYRATDGSRWVVIRYESGARTFGRLRL